MRDSSALTVKLGTKFFYDGEVNEIVEMHTVGDHLEVVANDLGTGTVRRLALGELMFSDRCRILDDDLGYDRAILDGETAAVKWSAASHEARAKARSLAAHVREVATGFRSGTAASAAQGEPRAAYRPELPLGARVAAKARELGVGVRTVERWLASFRQGGEAALISGRDVRPALARGTFEVFEQTALEVMIEYTELSKPTRKLIIGHARARIIKRYGADTALLPSMATAYRILERLERVHPQFTRSAARNRDIASRPPGGYGQLHPERPGEYILMDTTRLDVFAMDPQTLRWVPVELTVAMDWYSGCVCGLRVTPGSTKSVDAAAVLYECLHPAPAGRDWPAESVWPPMGFPRTVLVEQDALDPDSVFAAGPAVVPETIIVDHGRIYVGEHLTSTCRRLGISIQPARVRIGRDKGPVERFFGTVRQGFVQELPGYKGPDVHSRGVCPEDDAFLFLDELEALLREWIATVYHRRPHEGRADPRLWSLRLSPAQMFERVKLSV